MFKNSFASPPSESFLKTRIFPAWPTAKNRPEPSGASLIQTRRSIFKFGRTCLNSIFGSDCADAMPANISEQTICARKSGDIFTTWEWNRNRDKMNSRQNCRYACVGRSDKIRVARSKKFYDEKTKAEMAKYFLALMKYPSQNSWRPVDERLWANNQFPHRSHQSSPTAIWIWPTLILSQKTNNRRALATLLAATARSKLWLTQWDHRHDSISCWLSNAGRGLQLD